MSQPVNIYDAMAAARLPQQMEARMANATFTPEERQKIRTDFRRWMAEHGIPQARVTERLGVSVATASQVLSGAYKANPDKYLGRLLGWMQDQEASLKLLRSPVPLTIAELECLKDIRGIVEHAVADNTCALIVGPSGCCKTTYALARCKQYPNSLYIDLDDDRYSNIRLLRRIATTLNMQKIPGDRQGRWAQLPALSASADRLMDAICERLRHPPRVLFVDNAHLLNVRNLWTLHAIHDRTRSTVICMGLPALLRTVQNSRDDLGVGGTVYSRFAYKLDLADAISERVNPIDPSHNFKPRRQYMHTTEDVAAFLDSLRVRVHKGALAWLHREANRPNAGGWHTVKRIVLLAARTYEGAEQLTLEHLLQAYRVVAPTSEQKLAIDADRQEPAAAVG